MRGRDSSGSNQTLLGVSFQLRCIRRTIARAAEVFDPVLITGETGVGKEVVARTIHARSRRSKGPFVAVNLCALGEGILESELFGHERGAFTGAIARRRGRFEQALGGTILLDEIGDASARVQAELLRVVETRSIDRLGGSGPIHVDVRIMAATNRDLPAAIEDGRFRRDLWYRLTALRIHVPPLRERPEDIAELIRLELRKVSAERRAPAFQMSKEGYARMRNHPWLGNARELRMAVRRMAILAGERRTLDGEDVGETLGAAERFTGTAAQPHAVSPPRDPAAPTEAASRSQFARLEREALLKALNAQRWNVSAAARELGLSRSALRHRMKRLGFPGREKDRSGDE